MSQDTKGVSGSQDRGEARDADLEARIDSIVAHWHELDDENLKRAMDKAREYDGLDLEIMGAAMAGLLPPGLDSKSAHALGLEMAIAFYTLGKITRTLGAFRQGRTPVEDDWYDLEIYARMARIIRHHGRWT
jgi:hypothetical protein